MIGPFGPPTSIPGVGDRHATHETGAQASVFPVNLPTGLFPKYIFAVSPVLRAGLVQQTVQIVASTI